MSDCVERDKIMNFCNAVINRQGNEEEMNVVVESFKAFAEYVKVLPSAQPYTAEEIDKMQELESALLEKAYELGRESAQPEEAIPVSWIESRIERFMMAGDAFSGLTASIIRVMLNEWKKEQEGETDGSD